jgi:sirohydrochlorin cobaltochelatase
MSGIMKTIIVLAAHGAPPTDFPPGDQAEYFGLHHQLDHAGETDRHRWLPRFEELDQRMRSWPRTPANDPFWAASMELGAALEQVIGVRVLVGFNEFCAPSLDEALDDAASFGPDVVKIATPMLTRGGEHAERDIPAAIARATQRHPTVRFAYAWPYRVTDVAGFMASRLAEL